MKEKKLEEWRITFNSEYSVTKEELEVMALRSRIKQSSDKCEILFYPVSPEEERQKWLMMASARVRIL